MKIIVISDSHGSDHAVKKIMELHSDCDIVVHCGDCRDEMAWVQMKYPDKQYYMVRGNCDIDSMLPLSLTFTAEGVTFFVTHGHGYGVKYGLGELERAAREAGAQVALFGHTHVPHDEYVNGIRLFNPGSAGYMTEFGIIEVKDGQVLSSLARIKRK